jgi:hypothetical protein
MSDFLIFRRFESMDEAIAIQKIFNKKNIPSVLDEDKPVLDNPITGQQLDILPYHIKIPAEHFTEADKILRHSIDSADADEDYYLLSFSDDELLEVIEKKDEWGSYDYALALKLLEERGITLGPDDFALLQAKRIKDLSTPEKGTNWWIVAGYLSATLGGLMGIGIGLYMITAKKTLPDGIRIHTYNSKTRRHGSFIFSLGLIAFILWNIFFRVFDGSLENVFNSQR